MDVVAVRLLSTRFGPYTGGFGCRRQSPLAPVGLTRYSFHGTILNDHHGKYTYRRLGALHFNVLVAAFGLLDASGGSIPSRQIQVAEGDETRFFYALWVKKPLVNHPTCSETVHHLHLDHALPLTRNPGKFYG